jgi:fumarate reductase flavoprotein subunit
VNDGKVPEKKFSRRSFLKGAGTSVVAVAGGSLLGACAPKVNSPESTESSESTKSPASTSTSRGKYSWETAPAPIAASQIKQKIDTEVLVIGFGASGVTAALRAAEQGAKVVVMQKFEKFFCPGSFVGGVGSKKEIAGGWTPDIMPLLRRLQISNGNKTDFNLLKLWANQSGKVIDWMDSYGTAANVPMDWAGLSSGYVEDADPWGAEYPDMHLWKGFFGALGTALADAAVKKGVDVHYSTPAVQLIREGQARVTGAIGKDKDGNYIQVNASKGVILCTGDYGGNPEMVEKYCPIAVGFKSSYQSGLNSGDGQLMGMWVGGKMQEWQHAPMIHFDPPDTPAGEFFWSATPWLWVNKRGERFMDEDCPYNQACWGVLTQPEHSKYQICDSDWNEQWPNLGGDARWTRGMISLDGWHVPAPVKEGQAAAPVIWAKGIKDGAVIQADTIEELADKLGLPKDALVASVKRYNELVDKGVDEDYGKRSDYLKASPIKKAPFFGIFRRPTLLTVPGGGIWVNTKLQILDTNHQVIPGLYAAGNCAGGFFGQDYPLMFSGISMGRATTFGYLAGEFAAEDHA